MADINKIGLLILNQDQTKFLVCRKDNFTSDWLMPGGQIEKDESNKDCLKREIKEELNCQVELASLKYIDKYNNPASGALDKIVEIKLYQGKIVGEIKPSSEIIDCSWISAQDIENREVSPIIKNKIIPDLLQKNILKKE